MKCSETLCWTCDKAIGKCPWSIKFQPVDGWTAEPTIINSPGFGQIKSFKIIACPMYKKEQTTYKTNAEKAAELGVSVRHYYRIKRLSKEAEK